jgi:beta-galactosidase
MPRRISLPAFLHAIRNLRIACVIPVTCAAIAAFVATIPASAASATVASAPTESTAGRERLRLDEGWRFSLGHPSDTKKDFDHATGYFSYLAKTGFGDGPASVKFDDSAWRRVDLPHDWAVEMPFSANASHSHGYRAIGPRFPDTNVGWYRRKITVPAADLGRRISLVFDGVFRDSQVWINGFYLGREPSGYLGFRYDVTDYLNYGGENTIAVRADATMEEGWFYEGAGIYRHVWLEKTDALHLVPDGTAITTSLRADGSAEIGVTAGITNAGTDARAGEIVYRVLDRNGHVLAEKTSALPALAAGATAESATMLTIAKPELWSVESPALHTLAVELRAAGTGIDRTETRFGIRTIRFDPDAGFFLNGKRVELKGTNNHQDHAGVGAAIPDALQDYRIAKLKEMGSNAYRCSHNPPTPELLDACDRLGMLVIDETRLMGSNAFHLDAVARMIRRDRNHPSVILWSLGNEEWAIEGNITGARIAATMQAFAKRLDPTRLTTVAISGGWGGISTVIDVAGVNYIKQGDPDKQHAEFPKQIILGTEETTTQATRGIYFDDKEHGHLAPLEDGTSGGNIETGWKYYAARPYLAGVCYWTGFDYRGEPNPLAWPAASSQFGILDTCGFPKDSFYYLKAWWTDEPVLHIFPHWNWPGRDGQTIQVRCFSNHEAVELFLNGRSLGKKDMPRNGHLAWDVVYEPGVLEARGYRNNEIVETRRVETTGAPASLVLSADRSTLTPDNRDVSVITVSALDGEGRAVPTADNPVQFTITGDGKIIGVGNGDPGSHEPDKASERRLFNGLAQVIVQTTHDAGPIVLRATAPGLREASITLTSAVPPPSGAAR